jgi:hypothetical protein
MMFFRRAFVLGIACAVLVGVPAAAQTGINVVAFHGDRQRTGWNPQEVALTPATVSGPNFQPLWNSPVLDSVMIGSKTFLPHLYASPLYVNDDPITAGAYAGRHFSVILAATSNGFVYAINAFANAIGGPLVPPGAILWSKSLGRPSVAQRIDGGVPLGIMGTPFVDLNGSRPRMYVAADVQTRTGPLWKVFALDIGSGRVLPRWPLTIDNGPLGPINQNGPAVFGPAWLMSQRGALNLSADGSILYVPFGAYRDNAPGWMVSVDTLTPKLLSAFSGAPSTAITPNGGMWGSGGPAIDLLGNVYETTGNSAPNSDSALGVWGQSLLVWPNTAALQLSATYTPWNYCQLDLADSDLGGDSPIVVPDLNPATTATPRLVAFGSKQGNLYLIDRDHINGGLTARQNCSTDPPSDLSLLPPNGEPYYGGLRGPLNVFGPYSETGNRVDLAKARTTPAFFQTADGTPYLFYSGSTKASTTSRQPVPPSLARMRIVTAAGQPAYLFIDAADTTLAFLSPGSPVVSSNGSNAPIVWVLDANLFRSQPLIGPNVPHPVLYAVDAATMKILWTSTQAQLDVGGKYNTPIVAGGVVFVGTDRIQAFGLTGPRAQHRL